MKKTKKNMNTDLFSFFSFLLPFSLLLSWLFIANEQGTTNLIHRKKCTATTNPPTIINLCIINFVLLYIIVNIYMGKTKKLKSILEKSPFQPQ